MGGGREVLSPSQGWAVGKGTLFASLHHNITYSMFITIKINLNQLLQFVNSKRYHKNETKTLLKSIKKLEKLQTRNKKEIRTATAFKKVADKMILFNLKKKEPKTKKKNKHKEHRIYWTNKTI